MINQIIKEFNREHGYIDSDTIFVKRLRLLDLSDRQIAGVITILDTICLNCMDSSTQCRCEDDE